MSLIVSPRTVGVLNGKASVQIHMTRSRTCGWKIGARTACPVLIDNLTEEEVDLIWAEVSRINWTLRAQGDLMVAPQIPSKLLSNSKRRSQSSAQLDIKEGHKHLPHPSTTTVICQNIK